MWCSSLRSLKEELAKATEEEELWLREEESKKLSKLRTQISAETEAEKEKIRWGIHSMSWKLHAPCLRTPQPLGKTGGEVGEETLSMKSAGK